MIRFFYFIFRSESFANDAQIFEKLNQLSREMGNRSEQRTSCATSDDGVVVDRDMLLLESDEFAKSNYNSQTSLNERKISLSAKEVRDNWCDANGLHKDSCRGEVNIAEQGRKCSMQRAESQDSENLEQKVSDYLHNDYDKSEHNSSRGSRVSSIDELDVGTTTPKKIAERTGKFLSVFGAKVNKLSNDMWERAEARIGRRNSEDSIHRRNSEDSVHKYGKFNSDTKKTDSQKDYLTPSTHVNNNSKIPAPRSPSIPIRRSPHSPARTPVTENDPLGVFGNSTCPSESNSREGSEDCDSATSESSSALVRQKNSFDLESLTESAAGGPVLFGAHGAHRRSKTEEAGRQFTETSKESELAHSRVSRSATYHHNLSKGASQVEDVFGDNTVDAERKKVIQRSSTMPMDSSLSHDSSVPSASASMASSFSSLSSSFKLPFRYL